MIVGYGVSVPKGSLPVFSVDTAEQAERLLTLACATNGAGEYVAAELTSEQTIENLAAFSDRLGDVFDKHRDYIEKGR